MMMKLTLLQKKTQIILSTWYANGDSSGASHCLIPKGTRTAWHYYLNCLKKKRKQSSVGAKVEWIWTAEDLMKNHSTERLLRGNSCLEEVGRVFVWCELESEGDIDAVVDVNSVMVLLYSLMHRNMLNGGIGGSGWCENNEAICLWSCMW